MWRNNLIQYDYVWAGVHLTFISQNYFHEHVFLVCLQNYSTRKQSAYVTKQIYVVSKTIIVIIVQLYM